jgi:hypothetical protein
LLFLIVIIGMTLSLLGVLIFGRWTMPLQCNVGLFEGLQMHIVIDRSKSCNKH